MYKACFIIRYFNTLFILSFIFHRRFRTALYFTSVDLLRVSQTFNTYLILINYFVSRHRSGASDCSRPRVAAWSARRSLCAARPSPLILPTVGPSPTSELRAASSSVRGYAVSRVPLQAAATHLSGVHARVQTQVRSKQIKNYHLKPSVFL